MLGEYAAGDVTAQRALAHHVHRLSGVDLAEPPAQFVYGDVDKAVRAAAGVFAGGAHVQAGDVFRQMVDVLVVELLDLARFKVLDHEAGHVHRVLGRGIGRGVGEVEVLEGDGVHARLHGRGQHVDALVHAVEADDLRAEEAQRALFVEHLHGHGLAAGIVGGVAGRGEHHLVIGKARGFGGALVEAGGRRRHVKELDHAAAPGGAVNTVQTGDVVRRHAALLVGRPREGDERRLMRDAVFHLHRVAHGVDVRVRGAHVLVHEYAAARAHLQPRRLGKAAVRGNADGEDDHLRGDGRADVHVRDHLPVLFFKAGHGAAQPQRKPLGAELGVDKGGHVRVQRAQKLLHLFHDGHLRAALGEVFRHFQPDEAAADHRRRGGPLFIHELADAQRVLHRAQCEDVFSVDARQRRHHGARAGGEHQFVVAFLKLPAAFEVAHGHGLAGAVDGHHLVAHAHVHIEAGAEVGGRLQRQRRFFRDRPAHVVGQAAVGVGDEAGLFKDDDLRAFIQPAQARRARRAAGHAADDDDLHDVYLLIFIHCL